MASHPDVFEERARLGPDAGAQVPQVAPADFVKAGYAQGILTVPAADNVVRLLPAAQHRRRGHRRGAPTPRRPRPPQRLILSDPKYPRGSGGRQPPGLRKRPAMNHFLDIDKTDAADLRGHDRPRPRHEGRPQRPPQGQPPTTSQPLAGPHGRADLREALDPHPRLLRRGRPADGRRRPWSSRAPTCSSATARPSPTPRGSCRRYVDLIMIRTFEEATLLEMAEHATVPVINGLTNRTHPCQIMADVMTYEEHRGPIAGPQGGLVRRRQQRLRLLGAGRGAVRLRHRPSPARRRSTPSPAHPRLRPGQGRPGRDRPRPLRRPSQGADLVVTDTWVSMHDPQSRPRAAAQPAPRLPGQRAPDGRRQARRALHALPARAPRRRGDERGDGRPAVGRSGTRPRTASTRRRP